MGPLLRMRAGIGGRSRFSSSQVHPIDGPTGGDQEQLLVSLNCLVYTKSGFVPRVLALSKLTPKEGRHITTLPPFICQSLTRS